MKFSDIEKRARRKIGVLNYTYCYYLEFDFTILNKILKRKRNGSHSDVTYSESYIMMDTETSKDHPAEFDPTGKAIPQHNHIVCWTLSIRAFHENICTLRGSKPSELMHCLKLIRENIQADVFYIFVHNLAFDHQFLRRFLYKEFGTPKSQLNVRSHYPISIQFNNGMIIRDSLILAGVSLEKWGANLNVEHKKAVGYWNYEVIRNQNTPLTDEELTYIEFDTLTGVECLNKLADNLGDTVVSLPFTNTGIVRRRVRKQGRKCHAKQIFNKQLLTYPEYQILEKVFHGGFTHSNRSIISWIRAMVSCYDFKSSYPYCMLTGKFPNESFYHMDGVMHPDDIIRQSEDRAFIFRLIMVKPRLKDPRYPMPALQFYKCESTVNAVNDNGRILCADYVEIYMNEIDLKIINDIYICDEIYCVEIMTATKDYLPRWFRDEVYSIFTEKCELEYQIKVLKTGDISLYNIKKAQLNSLFGMCVTKAIKDQIIECYDDDPTHELSSGDYYLEKINYQKEFDKYNKKRDNVLPYVWGVYVTSYAMYNLFQLSDCINNENDHWIYSDTDSIYSDNWNTEKVEQYNDNVKAELQKAGYDAVRIHDHVYWLGIAEFDGSYDKFITLGAKRYATEKNKKIKITVAGVPKKAGACCLRSLKDFKDGFIFHGDGTGKILHTYMNHEIDIDEHGNEYADSIDLSPNDYTLSSIEVIKFEDLFKEEVTIDFYEDI